MEADGPQGTLVRASWRQTWCEIHEMPARILVVDDVPAVRNGLRALLSSHQLEICGEAENGQEAVDPVRELFPDIVVLDISMPVMDGLRAAMEIRRVAPSTKIVLFSIHDGP